jgi:hypothetical protein
VIEDPEQKGKKRQRAAWNIQQAVKIDERTPELFKTPSKDKNI